MKGFIEKLTPQQLPLATKAPWLAILVGFMAVALVFGVELKYVIALAITDFQQMHVDLYWLSLERWWNNTSHWTLATYVFFGALIIYTSIKAVTIVRYYDVDDGQYGKRLSSLMAGCGLAAFAPYRMTQASVRMKDEEVANDMAAIRIKTITTLKVANTTAQKIGIALSEEPNGLSCVTDLSSTYIASVMKKNKLSPNNN